MHPQSDVERHFFKVFFSCFAVDDIIAHVPSGFHTLEVRLREESFKPAMGFRMGGFEVEGAEGGDGVVLRDGGRGLVEGFCCSDEVLLREGGWICHVVYSTEEFQVVIL